MIERLVVRRKRSSVFVGLLLIVALMLRGSFSNTIRAQVTSVIQIKDVFGLANALALRPTMGVGYSPRRAAVINGDGLLDGAAGAPGYVVMWDGSTAEYPPPAPPGPIFVDGEVPAGTANGANSIFYLAQVPNPPASLHLYRNGVRLSRSLDFSLAGSTITFVVSAVPQMGDVLLADYRK